MLKWWPRRFSTSTCPTAPTGNSGLLTSSTSHRRVASPWNAYVKDIFDDGSFLLVYLLYVGYVIFMQGIYLNILPFDVVVPTTHAFMLSFNWCFFQLDQFVVIRTMTEPLGRRPLAEVFRTVYLPNWMIQTRVYLVCFLFAARSISGYSYDDGELSPLAEPAGRGGPRQHDGRPLLDAGRHLAGSHVGVTG